MNEDDYENAFNDKESLLAPHSCTSEAQDSASFNVEMSEIEVKQISNLENATIENFPQNDSSNSCPKFLAKLVTMLRVESPDIMGWESGKIFFRNPQELVKQVLKKYFRHANYHSFERQLNYFGFRKIEGRGKLEPCVYLNKELEGLPVEEIFHIKRKVKSQLHEIITTPTTPPSEEKPTSIDPITFQSGFQNMEIRNTDDASPVLDEENAKVMVDQPRDLCPTIVTPEDCNAKGTESDSEISKTKKGDLFKGTEFQESILSHKDANNTCPEFLMKLVTMLKVESPEIMSWEAGKIFFKNPRRLVMEVLKRYFRHANYHSFQRQLNYFGFRKIEGRGKFEPCVYSNKELEGSTIDEILQVKRKVNAQGQENSTTTSAPEFKVGPSFHEIESSEFQAKRTKLEQADTIPSLHLRLHEWRSVHPRIIPSSQGDYRQLCWRHPMQAGMAGPGPGFYHVGSAHIPCIELIRGQYPQECNSGYIAHSGPQYSFYPPFHNAPFPMHYYEHQKGVSTYLGSGDSQTFTSYRAKLLEQQLMFLPGDEHNGAQPKPNISGTGSLEQLISAAAMLRDQSDLPPDDAVEETTVAEKSESTDSL